MNTKILTVFLLLSFSDVFAYTAIGILQGKEDITLASRSQGEVSIIHFKEGSPVNAGDIIAQIENEKEQIEKSLAENEYQTAKSDYEKSVNLKKYISEDELTKKKNLFLTKKSNLDLKNYNLKSKFIITPITGVLARTFLKKGEYISSGTKAFEIVQPESLVIELNVDAAVAKSVTEGSMLTFNSELHKNAHKAEVFYIGSIIDKASGTVSVKLKLKNPVEADKKYLFQAGEMVKVHFN